MWPVTAVSARERQVRQIGKLDKQRRTPIGRCGTARALPGLGSWEKVTPRRSNTRLGTSHSISQDRVSRTSRSSKTANPEYQIRLPRRTRVQHQPLTRFLGLVSRLLSAFCSPALSTVPVYPPEAPKDYGVPDRRSNSAPRGPRNPSRKREMTEPLLGNAVLAC